MAYHPGDMGMEIKKCGSEDASPSAAFCSTHPLEMTDEEILAWGKETYGDRLPEKLAELRTMIDNAIKKSRKNRKA